MVDTSSASRALEQYSDERTMLGKVRMMITNVAAADMNILHIIV
jgi:hypothetical protein